MRGYKKLVSSGLVNIGCIPENWYVAKINYFSKLQTGGTPNKDIIEYWENGNVNWMSSGEVNNEFIFKTKHKITELGMKNSNASILPVNSVMMALNGQGKTKGTVAVLKVETTCNQSLAAFITDENHLHYLYLYYFLKYNYKFIRGLVGDGLRDGISMGLLKSLKICLPTYEEQRTIGEFLYKKEQEIKTLIEQKESLIRLLEQQRQSIITEAVTKGLNPNVKMKDSGVEWIGEIPEHWSILALKHIASEKKHSFVDGPFGSDLKNEEYVDSGVPVIQLNNIKNGDLRVINMNFVTKKKSEQLKRHIAYPGDLVIAKMASPIARSAVVPKTYENYVIVADCIKLKLKENYLNHYINFAMNTPFTIAQAESFANGTTRSRVNLSIIKNLKLPIPNFEEQKEIASYLTLKVSEVNNVIKAVENQIQKLKEYRQSLIYEAVTGKIDVRDMELDEVR
ncbi:restriction endonuclease subunit S [Bacillus altitudinis]|uniref:restriction endonuclease subunit S n=1 Tax=Bacillus altitudinis TaxID=293387 RepID=UPI0038B61B9B